MSELQQNGHTDTQGLLPTHLFERVDVEPSSVVSHRLAWWVSQGHGHDEFNEVAGRHRE